MMTMMTAAATTCGDDDDNNNNNDKDKEDDNSSSKDSGNKDHIDEGGKDDILRQQQQQQQQKEEKKKLVNQGRWKILRDAILSSSSSSTTTTNNNNTNSASIHRFEGYNLLSPAPVCMEDGDIDEGVKSTMESLLTTFEWDTYGSQSLQYSLDRLEIAVLALVAAFPKGKCLKVVTVVSSKEDEDPPPSSDEWFPALQERFMMGQSSSSSSVCIWKVDEKQQQQQQSPSQQHATLATGDEKDDSLSSSVTTTTTTYLFVQESSSPSCTKYRIFRYSLNDDDDDDQSLQLLSLWTREPRSRSETKLSLEDLVCHRHDRHPVDNTGNIQVWDSERTLAYLLFHHCGDFFSSFQGGVGGAAGVLDDSPSDSKHQHQLPRNILELGTGMAGLAAVALGLRWAISRETTKHDNNDGEVSKSSSSKIHVTLTDGNPGGVKNNQINQCLTKIHSQAQKPNGHPYGALDVTCQQLLWTTHLDNNDDDTPPSSPTIPSSSQDVVLVSDCTHFQNFHAALAVTTLRYLKVGGVALFCQPSRGKSLENFCNLLFRSSTSFSSSSSSSSTMPDASSSPLVSCQWFPQDHVVLETKHQEALQKYGGKAATTTTNSNYDNIYDENLHRPKIWMVTKLRDMTEDDRIRMISHHEE